WFFNAKPDDFKKIPGSPIAYWVSDKVRDIFQTTLPLSKYANPVVGLQTGDNTLFLRYWNEVNVGNIGFNISDRNEAVKSKKKWFPFNKGGEFCKWYGNQDYIVNWYKDGEEVRGNVNKDGKTSSRPQNTNYYFQGSVSWSKITSSYFSMRYFP
ncbi:SAM-dependent methyltransferase, partial [Acinetobacter bereziniae]|nr:SAM-dependent methyltransferase [Acinetobacter bereziniae]